VREAREGEEPASAGLSELPAPTVLLECTDVVDPTSSALLTVDASYQLTWRIGLATNPTQKSTLIGVEHSTTDGIESYDLQDTLGFYLDLNVPNLVIAMSTLDVQCDPATATIDWSALDHLVAATTASRVRQRTYATCRSGDVSATFTVRPSLGGSGALIEGNDADGDAVALLATSVRKDLGTVTYTGQGALTVFGVGQHVSSFTTIFSQTTASDTTLGWDGTFSGEPVTLTNGVCDVSGDAFASGLIVQHASAN
jgi:hypothetical protein